MTEALYVSTGQILAVRQVHAQLDRMTCFKLGPPYYMLDAVFIGFCAASETGGGEYSCTHGCGIQQTLWTEVRYAI